MNIREFKKLKENGAVQFKKENDKNIAEITTYNTYTGEKEIKEEEIDIIRLENEKRMYENQRDEAQERLNETNLLLNNINLWEKKKKKHNLKKCERF